MGRRGDWVTGRAESEKEEERRERRERKGRREKGEKRKKRAESEKEEERRERRERTGRRENSDKSRNNRNKEKMEKIEADSIIVGAGLTGLTVAFYLARAGQKVVVLEKTDHIGGVIRTIHQDGFIFETGPNTGVYSSPELVSLFDDLEGTAVPEFANAKGKQRWIWKKGQWHALPSGLGSAVGTPLFTIHDKFRILGEPFRKKGTDPYESVAQLVRRRMGKSFLEYAVDPFISGIYAGDPEKLVTRFALPKLYRLEQDYGSFIRGAMKKRREPRDELTRRATREVFSVKGGLQELTEALGNKIGRGQIITGTQDLKIIRRQKKYEAAFKTGGKEYLVSSAHVVTTVPGPALENMFSFISTPALKPILDLRYAKVVQVIAAYRKWAGPPLNAFGGLIPSREKRDALGILFTSSIFNDRTPEGGAILSVFMGGDRRPGFIEKSDEEIRTLALQEITGTLGQQEITGSPGQQEISGTTGQQEIAGTPGQQDLQPGQQQDLRALLQPDFMKIFRYPYAIPQYEASTEQRLEAIEKMEAAYPGIHLAGNIRDGIGMADRVKQGYQVAMHILKDA
ncbi:MAG: protoporphyrinogen oxidase [Bacteroidales bacterium]|nr:protoporphyrinogen oxidase [Bacteroidales bacterium]